MNNLSKEKDDFIVKLRKIPYLVINTELYNERFITFITNYLEYISNMKPNYRKIMFENNRIINSDEVERIYEYLYSLADLANKIDSFNGFTNIDCNINHLRMIAYFMTSLREILQNNIENIEKEISGKVGIE